MRTPRFPVWRVLIAAMLLLTGCGLPGQRGPSAQPTPTALAIPLPPALVETAPAVGGQLTVDSPLTFYFNQPMNRASVEAAINLQPPGALSWTDDYTLVFTPSQPYPADTSFDVYLAATAAAANGLTFPEPVTLTFRTAATLQPVQVLPENGAADVDPTGAIVVVFNQPVVPLGADPTSLPAGFLIQPAAAGRGEWLNTSTCIFYPDPSLAGGTTYTVRLNPGLVSSAGTPLDPAAASMAWTFTTALPRLVSIDPDPLQTRQLGLVPEITLQFNQPMDPPSVEGAFIFSGPNGIVNGQIEWNEAGTAFTFTPGAQLQRATAYTLILGPQARALGGTPMGQEIRQGFVTYGNFELTGNYPGNNGVLGNYRDVELTFSTPLDEDQDLNDLITISPAVVNAYVYTYDEGQVAISGSYEYETAYTVTLSPNLKDAWGQPLGRAVVLRLSTQPANPSVEIPAAMGYNTIFLRTGKPAVGAYATNISYLNVSLAGMSLADFINQSSNYGASYFPSNPATGTQTYNLPRSRSTQIEIGLPAPGGRLSPGLYYINIDSPEDAMRGGRVLYAAASDINVTFKRGEKSAMVWAVYIDSQQPVANAAVGIYNRDGGLLAEGRTDGQGVWQGSLPTDIGYEQRPYLVMVSQPGQPDFGLAIDGWFNGVGPWDFNVFGYVRGEHAATYLYSDRPIYRPGQTVYFRGVIRDGFDGRYAIPDDTSITLSLESYVDTLATLTLPLSPYGTFEGEYTLPETTAPGYYTLRNSEFEAYLSIPVADYRKPEFELNLTLSPEDGLAGDKRQATVTARYYFDAPVGGLPVTWRLYARPSYFPLSGYTTGTYDDNWFGMRTAGEGWYGTEIASGEATTGADGKLAIDLPALEQDERTRWLTLEVTAEDESGLPVSTRVGGYVHPSSAYIGIRPEQWVGQAGTPLEFEIITADWQGQPAGDRPLTAKFQAVTWERTRVATYYWQYTPVFSDLASASLVTGADGKARVSFTPPSAGTFLLDVQGGGAHSQRMVWVSGGANAAWPDLGEDRLGLTSDQESYQPGDTARVLIPNPLGRPALALISIERDTVLSYEIKRIEGSSLTYAIDLTDRYAPNAYINVILLDPQGGFRMGMLNLPVEPSAFALKVELTSTPQRSEPGGKVTLDLRVTDQFGAPVQGEFSVAVVDKAALALADPNSGPILEAFYGNQPLGMLTSLSLAAAGDRLVPPMGGRGGGGGDGAVPSPREDFPDTAYWNPTLVTGADGRGQVQVSLPDNLTTWTIDVRGLTVDTRVGQGTLEVVSTKDLLIRPVTPRFLVQGDHLELSAVVNNNTASNLQATVSLNAAGFVLDDPAEGTQKVTVPANGRVRVAWWGTAVNGPAELIFSVKAGSLEDSSRPVWGALPVLQYTAPRTFVTAGVLPEAGTRSEVISLPRSFSPTGGGLSVELDPSLASMLISTLDILPVPPADGDAEWILSYFLPNLEVYRALQASGLDNPALQVRLESSLEDNVRLLMRRQNEDGGWGWHAGQKSDLFISAYVLFGLGRFREAGLDVKEEVIQRGREYLISNRPYFGGGLASWELDRVVFVEYALYINGGAEIGVIDGLYDYRDQLSPWAQALLALMLSGRQPGLADSLITNLETGAIRTASGAHWESAEAGWNNPGSSLFTTAAVIYTLAQRDPANPLLTDAVRYLASHRSALGGWGSTYDNAWILLALTEAMRGSGELQAGFSFSADFNREPIASGTASGPQTLTGVSAALPIESINPTGPNLLEVSRTDGAGRLYYRASLQVYQPVEDVEPLDLGIRVQREYLDFDCAANCAAIQSYSLSDDGSGLIVVRILVNVPVDAYYLVVEDFLPAGTEVLNKQLKTTQRGAQEGEGITTLLYDRGNPFAATWGWWYFSSPRIYDDHVQWTADYLPAGSYTLTYTLVPTQAGEFRVLPVRAWLSFFPEVQGTGGGQIFTIAP